LHKKTFALGERVFFRAHFVGLLRSGFFDAYVLGPQNVSAWKWAADTLSDDRPSTPGSLRGFVDYETTWHWDIPTDFPEGKYHIYLRVYDHLASGQRPVIEEKEEIIKVVSPPAAIGLDHDV
ncbi:MAG: hypothetical protein ACREBU_22650, partial [Nitrososphaera sp.]